MKFYFFMFFLVLFSENYSLGFIKKIFEKRSGEKERDGFYYQVKKGDNLWALSRKFNVSEERLKKVNNLKNGILPIKTIYIPRSTYSENPDIFKAHPHPKIQKETTESKKQKKITKLQKTEPKTDSEDLDGPFLEDFQIKETNPKNPVQIIPAEQKKEKITPKKTSQKNHPSFQWPVDSPILHPNGKFNQIDNGIKNSGILISVSENQPVYASHEGKIVFHGQLAGYGNTVILDHENNYFTLYCHLGKMNRLTQGQKIAQKTILGYTGLSGRIKVPVLHFEIRKMNKAMDPLSFLPTISEKKSP